MPARNIRTRSKAGSPGRRTERSSQRAFTKAEQILWRHLRDSRLEGFKFNRLHRIEGQVFAFYCPRANVAIEITQTSRRDLPRRDYKREAYLAAHGIQVLRFSEKEIQRGLDDVLDRILGACRAQKESRPRAQIAPVLPAPTTVIKSAPRIAPRRPAGWAMIVGIAIIATTASMLFLFWLNPTNRSAQGVALAPLATLTRGPTAAPRTSTPLPTETSLTILALNPRPVRTPNLILTQAEGQVDSQPQRVLDLLVPELSRFDSKGDLADAYFYLGRAELKLLHYREAAGYFKQLYALDPAVENLYMLAVSNDLSGDRTAALENYRVLAEWSGADAQVYRDLAVRRIKELNQPTSPPTPTP